MKTTIHSYHFDTRQPEQRAAFQALAARLQAEGRRDFKTHNGGKTSNYYGTGQKLDGRTVELDTKHLFNNQWNTAPIEGVSENGLRLHNWASDYPIDFHRAIERGYWIDLTDEMRAIRRETLKCGYCGAQEPAASGLAFCPHCLDNEYLKASDLFMTRLRPIDADGEPPPLTDEEKTEREPLYREAQIKGSSERGQKRIRKRRQDVEDKFQKARRDAQAEHDGFLWILDHCPGLAENCIYYTHTAQFSFGWRRPLDPEEVSALLDVIAEFPYPYKIETVEGRTLQAH